jgi:hypothetical protein
LVAL